MEEKREMERADYQPQNYRKCDQMLFFIPSSKEASITLIVRSILEERGREKNQS